MTSGFILLSNIYPSPKILKTVDLRYQKLMASQFKRNGKIYGFSKTYLLYWNTMENVELN